MTRRTIRQAKRGKLYERAEHMCEIKRPDCWGFGSNVHHRKNRSQGGNDELSNLLLACGSGTTGCHGWITEHPAAAKAMGFTVWRSDVPAEVPVVYRGAWARLDDEGYVHLLRRGEVRNELGHLSIGGPQRGASNQH